MLTFVWKSPLIVLATVLVCAFWVMGQAVFCHGGGQHCGEAVLESALNAFVASPIVLILVTLFFFPSEWKTVLAALAGIAAIVGGIAITPYLVHPADWHPEKFGEESQATSRYSLCLEDAARTVAQTSNDQPLVIARTSRARCQKERKEIFDTFRKYADDVSPGAMTDLEQKFWRKLPQIIAKARG